MFRPVEHCFVVVVVVALVSLLVSVSTRVNSRCSVLLRWLFCQNHDVISSENITFRYLNCIFIKCNEFNESVHLPLLNINVIPCTVIILLISIIFLVIRKFQNPLVLIFFGS